MSGASIHGIEISPDDPVERFDFISKVGEGSYGAVFKAIDKKDGLVVAVKVLDLQGDQSQSADLMKEIDILKRCQCEQIVAYRGTFVKNGKLWIAMEFCGAGSLSDLMAICDYILSEEEIAAVMEQCLLGLKYLHSNKKIHRDLKSGNILLTYEGECKLADFGVSAELASTLARCVTMIGTPYFMAPEVLSNSEYNYKADIWSLGITAYELATGAPPLADIHPMRAIFLIPTSAAPVLPSDINGVPFSPEFHSFISSCLQKDPDGRLNATDLLKHPFIKKSRGKRTIKALLQKCSDTIEGYRAEEALEQAELQLNDPLFNPQIDVSDDNGMSTVVSGGNTGTVAFSPRHHDQPFVPGNSTWKHSDRDVIENAKQLADFGAQSAYNNNTDGGYDTGNYGTVLIRKGAGQPQQQQQEDYSAGDYGTVLIRGNDGHFGGAKMQLQGGGSGTIIQRPTNTSGTISYGTIVHTPSPPPPSIARNTLRSSNLYTTVSDNSPVDKLQEIRSQLAIFYDQDKKSLEEFYATKLRHLDTLIAQKKPSGGNNGKGGKKGRK